MKYNVDIQASIGGRREQQDFYGSADVGIGFAIVVCDGMGGARGGAKASKMAVEIILGELNRSIDTNVKTTLANAIQKANAEIFSISRQNENFKGMGTTCTVLLLQNNKATVAHVGDSRIYQLRFEKLISRVPQVVFRTFDHSKVFELVKRGIITEEEARVSEDSNIILRALGIAPIVDVEITDNLPYLKGDRFMLCTDGICGALPENQLLELLSQKEDLRSDLKKLINSIDAIGVKAGGNHDNLTAALVQCGQNSLIKPTLTMYTKLFSVCLVVMFLLLIGSIGFGTYQRHLASQQSEGFQKDIKNLRDSVKTFSDSLNSLKSRVSLKKLSSATPRKTEVFPADEGSAKEDLNDMMKNDPEKVKGKVGRIKPKPEKNKDSKKDSARRQPGQAEESLQSNR